MGETSGANVAVKSARPRSKGRESSAWRWARRLGLGLGIAYPVALLAVVLAFRFIGERWWVTTVALYLPRLGFALPLPFVVVALILVKGFRLLWCQAASLVLLLFPLLGFHLHLPGPKAPTPGAFPLRVITFNINGASWGIDKVVGQIVDAKPDLAILQEVPRTDGPLMKAAMAAHFPFQQGDGQFIVASRFPVSGFVVPPSIPHLGKMRTAHYVRATVTTPAGDITVFDIHPVSPRDALDDLQGEGLRREVLSGRILDVVLGEGADKVLENARLRMKQIEAATREAASVTGPVLICGDTNLPHLSWALAHWLGGYQDGFFEAGHGVGYTFPAPKRTWMRIDRVLANNRFRFRDLVVPRQIVSDHLPVVAELELLPG
jgi:endonuclease/exonuclease/phosphatase (EEP) superfamily protein YafD